MIEAYSTTDGSQSLRPMFEAIADYVLESLKERSGFRIQDDMTVVAARVWG